MEIFYKPSLTSTNDYLKFGIENSVKKLSEFYTVRTGFQTKGRGQKNNIWESEAGKNILMSMLFYPDISAVEQFNFNMIFAMATASFLQQYISEKIMIKWPNDIYVNHSKIAGILIEHSLQGSVITYTIAGIGLNINQCLFSKNLPNPVSLSLLTNVQYDIFQMSLKYKDHVEKKYLQCKNAAYAHIKKHYLSYLYQFNQSCLYQDKYSVFKATIQDVDEYGRLVLGTEDGQIKKYAFKEIKFL